MRIEKIEKVETGVPIPERARSSGRPSLYPWAKMEVGSSFFVPLPAGETLKQLSVTLRTSASSRGRRHGEEYVVRASRKERGVRVWRTG